MSEKIHIYHKDYLVNDTLMVSLRETLHVIYQYRWLIWVNYKKDFQSRYKLSSLGLIWSIILPVIPVSIYIFLGMLRVIRVDEEIPFPVYMMIGMTFWLLIREGVVSGMRAIYCERGVITKINVPLIVFVISRYGDTCTNFIIRMTFMFIVMICYSVFPGWSILLFPVYLFPILCFGFGLGLILGIFNTVNQDIENTTNLFFTYGLFFSSVIFPMPTNGIVGFINSFNILNYLIVSMRDLIALGRIDLLIHFAFSFVFCILLVVISIKWLHVLQYKIKGLL